MLINGPINVVRLEGQINNIRKLIYVFFDYHNPVYNQTECDSLESITIRNYLYNIFKKVSSQLDFFFEIKKTDINNQYLNNYKHNYINNVTKLFLKYKFDADTKKNIKGNVRFHYLDIRDYLEKNIYNINNTLLNNISNIFVKQNINVNNYEVILECTDALVNELLIYKNFFEKEINKKLARPNLKENPTNDDIVFYYLNKITKKYKNNKIIQLIKNNYFDDILYQINLCINSLTELHNLILSLKNYVYRKYEEKNPYMNKDDNLDLCISIYINDNVVDTIIKCYKLYDGIHKKILYIFIKITDLFFLRRFLDKDYVTKAIVYTGSAHSINYINVLVSLFDFKITHFSFSEEKDLNKLNKIAKEDVAKLSFTLHPQKLIQCSDLSGFPDDFN